MTTLDKITACPKWLSLATRWTNGNITAAEEAVQEAYVMVARGKLPDKHPEPVAWFALTLHRKCLDQIRQEKRWSLQGAKISLENAPPVGRSDELDMVLDIMSKIDSLTPKRKSAILRRVAGFTWDEIGPLGGMSKTAGKKAALRGRAELKAVVA